MFKSRFLVSTKLHPCLLPSPVSSTPLPLSPRLSVGGRWRHVNAHATAQLCHWCLADFSHGTSVPSIAHSPRFPSITGNGMPLSTERTEAFQRSSSGQCGPLPKRVSLSGKYFINQTCCFASTKHLCTKLPWANEKAAGLQHPIYLTMPNRWYREQATSILPWGSKTFGRLHLRESV